jgi:ParB/RepB/Spo0J family partition protein
MATAVGKITLSASRDISFNKIVLSQSNVHRVKAGVSAGDLAEDIAGRPLLQSLNVRPVLQADREEIGTFEVAAGSRRFRARELLVKQKRMNKTQPVPCIVRTDGLAEDDSLAENVQRVALHPLDQFRAFQTLCEKGLGEHGVAVRFFVSPTVVKQRLRLAAVSDKLSAFLAMLTKLATLAPAHSRRSDESQALQQFSTPIGSMPSRPQRMMPTVPSTFAEAGFLATAPVRARAARSPASCSTTGSRGRRRATWIFKSDKLIDDAQRDVSALGHERLLVTPLSRFRQGTPIRLDQGILFTTYATLRFDRREEKVSRVRQIVDWLGGDSDAMNVLDESQTMQDAAGEKSGGEQAFSVRIADKVAA